MEQLGIFYGSSTGDTERVANIIKDTIGKAKASVHDILESSVEDIKQHSFLIFGIPTWGIGNLQEDWEEFITHLKSVDFKGKKVALFGLGDQESYPDTFADALGILFDELQHTGCCILGTCSVKGYKYVHSKAERNGKFVGLVLDERNQPELTRKRVSSWIQSLGL